MPRVSCLSTTTIAVLLVATFPAFAGVEPNEQGDSTVAESPTVQSEHGGSAPADDGAVAPDFALSPSQPAGSELPAPPSKTWYGWQTLGTDGIAILSFVLAASTEETVVLPAVGLGAYLLGGPTVHATHGNWGRAAISFGMRAAIPVATGGLLYAVNSCSDSSSDEGWCDLGAAVAALFGGVVGATVASVLDASVVAWERTEPTPQIVPTFGVNKSAAWLGVGGRF